MSGLADEPSRARNLHALSGVFPVGAFLVLHLLTNARALAGQDAFMRAAGFWEGLPLSSLAEAVLVLLPLAFHAGYGVVLMLRKGALDGSPYPDGWRQLVRGAAWVALVFIGYHVYALGLPRWTHAVGPSSAHTVLAAHLSRATGSAAGLLMPWTAVFYLVGLAATTLHFAAGTWGYAVRTGRAPDAKSKRQVAIGAALGGALLFGVSSLTVIGVATGAPLFAPVAESPPCPTPAESAPQASPAAPAAPSAASAAPAASH